MLRAVLRKAISAKISSCRMARKMIPLTVVKAGVFHGPKSNRIASARVAGELWTWMPSTTALTSSFEV